MDEDLEFYIKYGKEMDERMKKACEHESLDGECLEYGEMCFYEDQTLCPDYSLKWGTNNKK